MKELTAKQVEEVSGGYRVVGGVALGMLGNYLYDAMGGHGGINDALHSALRAATDYTQSVVSSGSRSGRARGALGS